VQEYANNAKEFAKRSGKNRIAAFAGELFRQDDLNILTCENGKHD